MTFEKKEPFLSFDPLVLMDQYKIKFDVTDLGLIVDKDNWPSNLILNKDLIHSDDMFYEQMCSDSTLMFYIESAIGRIKSLISRATHEQNKTWQHGLIHVFDIEGECSKPWMIRTRTNLAIRLTND